MSVVKWLDVTKASLEFFQVKRKHARGMFK